MKNNLFIDANGLRYSLKDVERPLEPEQIQTAEEWIKTHCKRIKSCCRRHSSYGLKHMAEDWGRKVNAHRKMNIFASYITNGAFIQAAQNLGYEIFPIFWTYNAFFNMSAKISGDDF